MLFFKCTDLNLIIKEILSVTLSDGDQISKCKVQGNSINNYLKGLYLCLTLL